MRMNPRERLLAPFRGGKPDRPAWCADLSYWYEAAGADGTLAPRYAGAEGYKLLHEDLGVCYYYDYSSRVFDCSHTDVAVTAVEEGGQRTKAWRTSRGEIAEHWTYVERGRCWAHDRYAVKDLADLRLLLDIWKGTCFNPCPEVFARLDRWVGGAGVGFAPAPRSPLPALLADWCGVEGTIYLLADHPQEAREVTAAIDKANDSAFDALLASPCELVHFCDNLDSAASTSLFDEWMRDYYEKRVTQLHRVGKFAAVHLDGRVRGLLPRLAACGFDAVESVTPAPVGDVEIRELRAVVENADTIIWGGVPGAMFCTPWKPGDIRRQTESLLEALAAGGRLVVGSADQVPPNGDIDYCRLVAETVESWSG